MASTHSRTHNSSTYTKLSKSPSKNGVLSVVQASETDKQAKKLQIISAKQATTLLP
jgi:hypothetical protein